MQNAQHIYPHNTPATKEAYYYRVIFERFFPQVINLNANTKFFFLLFFNILTVFRQDFDLILVFQNSARLTVPGGPSVACSTAKAVEWDAQWSDSLDPSGRAALGVHLSAYDPLLPTSRATGNTPAKVVNKKPKMVEVATPGHAIST